jgi:hypothetical protein
MLEILTSLLFAQNPTPDNFVTPSGNIFCALVGDKNNNLRCEIGTFLAPLLPQPYEGYCEFDWGAGLLLSVNGKAEVLCVSDTIAGSKNVLAYGQTWSKNGFQCTSQPQGLTCKNASGKGFFLSRQRWRVF